MRLRDAYKKYILQKKWVKKAIPALSSGQSNLQTPIGGCHRQLDDQNRNPNINNRDHLVGQLTTAAAACAAGRWEQTDSQLDQQSVFLQLGWIILNEQTSFKDLVKQMIKKLDGWDSGIDWNLRQHHRDDHYHFHGHLQDHPHRSSVGM